MKGPRTWAANWEIQYTVKTDLGPSFLKSWEKKIEKLSVNFKHSSAYDTQSMQLVERAVRRLQELLRKNPNLSQLQLAEHMQ